KPAADDQLIGRFLDDFAIVVPDPDHSSADEERLVLIGLSAALRVLVVVHCERDSGNVIRVISARRATRTERAQYDARWNQGEKNTTFRKANGIRTPSA